MSIADQRTSSSPPAEKPVPSRTNVTRTIVGGILILVGLSWSAERAGWIDVSATAVLAMATAITGLALMVRSRDGEHPGLIGFGIFLTAMTALTAAAPLEGFQGGIGDRTVTVTRLTDLESDYELGAGSMVIDLRSLDWEDGTGPIAVNLGMGELTVLVSPGTALDVRARAGVGQVTIRNRTSDGILVDDHYRSPDFQDATRQLRLEANVFVGTVEVSEQ